MTDRDEELLIRRMYEMAASALIFVEGLQLGDFLEDFQTQQAATMNLLIIGELASRALREQPEPVAAHPGIPWAEMRALRNRIAHS